MFPDCLEVEENLKMSKKLSDQDSCGEIKDTFKLVGPYKQNGKVSGPLKLPPDVLKDDWPEAGVGSPAGLFSKDGDLHRPWSTRDNFKKDFGVPMYDEYEEEYLQTIPSELVVELDPVDAENQDAMRSRKVKAEEGDKGTGGDILPLCYASFELIRHIVKASKQKKKETEVAQAKNLYRNEDGCSSL